MADADRYNALISEADGVADELHAIINDVRPDKTILQGSTGARRAGHGLEFFEMIDFHPELHERSEIDARASARKGEPYVRRAEDEALVRCFLWRATGPTMDPSIQSHAAGDGDASAEATPGFMARAAGRLRKLFGIRAAKPAAVSAASQPHGHEGRTKQDAADILLLAAARLLLTETQTNQVALLNGRGTVYTSRRQVADLATELMHVAGISRLGGLGDETLHLRKGSKVILFSDCLHYKMDEKACSAAMEAEQDPDRRDDIFAEYYTRPIIEDIEHMHAREATGHLVHIFDDREWNFPFESGHVRFRDPGDGEYMDVPHAGSMRLAYLKRVNAIQRALHNALSSMEWGYSMYVTSHRLVTGLTPLIGVANDGGPRIFHPDTALEDALADEAGTRTAHRRWRWPKAPAP